MRKADYLIIGQGIAGTLLAFSLLQRKKTIVVVDNTTPASASRVAAGLFNPIVFKRLTTSWKAAELLAAMDKQYPAMENFLGEKFYYKRSIHKILTSPEEVIFWQKKADEAHLSQYLEKEITKPYDQNQIEQSFGVGKVKNSGFVDVGMMLTKFREYLAAEGFLIEANIDYNDLNITSNETIWQDIRAGKIIFCEGAQAVKNPFFDNLPFKLTKGELITIACEDLNLNDILNKGVFILPVGEQKYVVGATHEWNDLSHGTTDKGLGELVTKLEKIIKRPYKIIEHKAAIRPTVADRRPIIGLLHKYQNIGIFNGLGTKGVMLAPYFAEQFCDFLEDKGSIDKEADVTRFETKKDIESEF